MYVIISPAKNQQTTLACPITTTTKYRFQTEVQELLGLLRQYSEQELGSLMSISPNIAKLNFQRYEDFNVGTQFPAGFLFHGDVYRGLDVASWQVQDCEYAQIHLGILSGLYGWLKFLDMISPYRLEMKTRLANAKGNTLYAFWADKITLAIKQHMQNYQLEQVVNLASQEYFKVINPKALGLPIIDIAFKEVGPKGLRVIAVKAKKARGVMAAYIIKNKMTSITDLQKFQQLGYKFSAEHSSAKELVFVSA